jgi:hypothetical protein
MTILFRVLVNGSEFTVAGESSMSSLTAILSAVGHLGPESQGTSRRRSPDPDIGLHVGGLTSRANKLANKQLIWANELALKPGDTVTIEVLDAEPSVEPTLEIAANLETKSQSSAKKRWRAARNLYERMRKKYGAREEKLEARADRMVRLRRITAGRRK